MNRRDHGRDSRHGPLERASIAHIAFDDLDLRARGLLRRVSGHDADAGATRRQTSDKLSPHGAGPTGYKDHDRLLAATDAATAPSIDAPPSSTGSM
jgi:hypothetical protein